MVKRHIPDKGDIYMANLDGVVGHEMQGQPRPVLVLTPAEFNKVSPPLCMPITQGGEYARVAGFAATLTGAGTQTQGAVITSQIRAIDLAARGGVFVEKVSVVVLDDVLGRIAQILGI